MRSRSRNLAALAIVGAGLLASCSSNGSAGGAAEAAGVAPPSTAPASSSSAPGSTASGLSVAKVSHSDLGDILVDGQGLTMYAFTNDTNGVSSCTGACAKTWPPVIVSAGFTPDASAKAANLHAVPRDDGTMQLAAGKWPLYTFSGDAQAGDVSGQGSGGKWFVVQPDGALHKTPSSAPTSPSTPASVPATTPKARAASTGY